MTDRDQPAPAGPSRRSFLKGTSIAVAGTSLVPGAGTPQEKAAADDARELSADGLHPIAFELNGKKVEARVRTGHTLLETLRDQLDLTGTKLVCDMGTCGACTVLLDGKPVNSCLTLAVDAHGHRVETIEGQAKDGQLSEVQKAFCEEDGLQCGFCTPGMVMSATALLKSNPAPTLDETKEGLSGNICRCGTYAGVFRAVQKASERMRGGR